MMGMYALATLVSVWFVCTGAHVIDKRQAIYPHYLLCVDTAVRVDSSPIFYVESPNFGNGTYQDYTRCNLVLQSGNETLYLVVHYESFDLEYQSECGFDSLCVGGYKFCGNWAAQQSHMFVIPPHKNFTLDFKTDGSVTGRGFQISVNALSQFLGDMVYTIVSGVGSSNISLRFDYISYSSSYSDTYQDKCSVDNNGGNWWTSPNYHTDNPWDYQTSSNYYTNNPWYYQTSQNYYTDYPWYYQTSPNYYTNYPWYYQTSPNYYTDYPYYYNTSPDRRQDTTFLRYFLYEALSALGEANYNGEAAIQSLQRAIAYLEGNAAGKK